MTAVQPSSPVRVELTRDGVRYTATVVWEGGRAWVHLAGDVFVIDPAVDEGHRRTGASTHDALSPPMPATVTRINVTVGDRVAAGDVLVLLEAMKMELPIRAPLDAVVVTINCRVGDLVQPGEPLVDLE